MTLGKDKAARVPLDYFRSVGRGRWLAAGAVLVLSLAGFGGAVASGWWSRAASPGAVHEVHAAWENDCAACHEPFLPTGSRNAINTLSGKGVPSDSKCQECHAGPPHHGDRDRGEADRGSCASCHRDHQGRHSFLMRPDDKACTRCHADLASHVKQGVKPTYVEKVTRFDLDHPQFRLPGKDGQRVPISKAEDPGKLKFNHALHMVPGQQAPTDARGWTLGDIPDKALRKRYRSQQPKDERKDSDKVRLNCASCHQLDPTDNPPPGPGQTTPPRPAGDIVQPVTYAQHCQACHPLTVETNTVKVNVPHHLQPDEVRGVLWGALLDQKIKAPKPDELTVSNPDAVTRPLPGANLPRLEADIRKRAEEELAGVEKVLFRSELGRAERHTFATKAACALCHVYEEVKGQDGKPTFPGKVARANVPLVWLQHSSFTHRPHRAVDCLSCHEQAMTSKTSQDVMLPGVESCKTCHRPNEGGLLGGLLATKKTEEQEKNIALFAQSSLKLAAREGGVRYDCVACHRYHNSDNPLAGRGALQRDAFKAGQRDLQKVLEGKSGRGPRPVSDAGHASDE